MARPNFIEIQDVSFGYEGRAVLKNVNLSLKGDRCYAIIGPNGGGKTTFLNLMMGCLTPDKGQILIDGASPHAFRESIGYVPQTPYFDKLFPLNVEELVLMGALHELSPLGFWSKTIKDNARKALELVKLSHKAKDPIGELSGGQTQRAFIARAIMNKPKILLFDEPTANLDPEAVKDVIELLNILKEEILIFIVTHDLDSITNLVDEVICIQNGVSLMNVRQLCHHFSLGVYHHFPKKDEEK
jgi:zinc transport system ATP-binding protein